MIAIKVLKIMCLNLHLDLRGTKCLPPVISSQMPFSPCKERKLFSSNLSSSLVVLQKLQHDIFSAPEEYQFILRIKNLCHESVASLLTDTKNLHQASASTSNSWHVHTHRYKCDSVHSNDIKSDIEDVELLRGGALEASGERDENAREGLWELRRDISAPIVRCGHSPEQLRMMVRFP